MRMYTLSMYKKGQMSEDSLECPLAELNIINSIDNLVKFPFIKKTVNLNDLNIYGLWINIETGKLEILNSQKLIFEEL